MAQPSAQAAEATPVGTPMALGPSGDAAPGDVSGDVPMADASEAPPAAGPAASASAAEAVDTDDDEVVQECEVFLNRMHDPPEFVGDMYVLQYPLRPSYRPYGDQGELDRVDFKSKSRRLRFIYKLTHNDNFDEDALASDKLGQRHVLTSQVVANPACSYAIAVVHQGKLTLTPVRAINQLRPDFEDYDKFKASQSRGVQPTLGPDGLPIAAAEKPKGDDSDSGPDESHALATVDALNAGPIRVDYTQAAKPAAEPEEPWARLDYYNRMSPEANDIYTKHIVWPAAAAAEAELHGYEANHPKLQKLELDGERRTFLGAMCGQLPTKRERKEKKEDDGLSVYVLSRMPIERQVEAVVRHFGVVSYSKQLRKRLPPATLRQLGSDDALLEHLKRCAVLVCGNWVLRSELAGFEGMEAHARDMLLCILSKKKEGLRREEYDKWAGVFTASTQRLARDEMTRGVMELDKDGERWRMKNPPDEDFERNFPSVVEDFVRWWDQHRMQITSRIGAASRQGQQGGAAMAQAAHQARQRARLMVQVQEALSQGGRSVPELRRHLQKNNPTIVVKEEDVVQVLQHRDLGAVQVRDVWVLEKSGNADADKFRQTLVSLFRVRDTVVKKDILAEYERLHGGPCKLSEYQMRAYLRELSDKADGDNFVLKGALTRS